MGQSGRTARSRGPRRPGHQRPIPRRVITDDVGPRLPGSARAGSSAGPGRGHRAAVRCRRPILSHTPSSSTADAARPGSGPRIPATRGRVAGLRRAARPADGGGAARRWVLGERMRAGLRGSDDGMRALSAPYHDDWLPDLNQTTAGLNHTTAWPMAYRTGGVRGAAGAGPHRRGRAEAPRGPCRRR